VRKHEQIFWLWRWIWGGRDARLETNLIEGDDIYLEYTEAAVVRGKKVTLGPGCEIGTLEYSESYQAHRDASVGKTNKIS
jgi:hypothetical protein